MSSPFLKDITSVSTSATTRTKPGTTPHRGGSTGEKCLRQSALAGKLIYETEEGKPPLKECRSRRNVQLMIYLDRCCSNLL